MWNKVLIIICFYGFLSIFDIFPLDLVIATLGDDRVVALETVAIKDTLNAVDSVTEDVITTDKKSVVPKYISPDDLTQFQRDSIINVIPKDTSSQVVPRHFYGNLAEKYATDNALDYERNINKSFFQRLKEVISELLRKFFGIPDVSKINKFSDILLRILLVAIFLVAVYIIIRLFINHRGRWFFEKSNETLVIDLTNVEKHIHEANFETLFNEAERSGDTRQSVRLLYLWLLRTFTNQQIIQWNPDKTNIDYLLEIQDKNLQEQFRYLSYLFNYIWYGEFSINGPDYKNVRESFFRQIKQNRENE